MEEKTNQLIKIVIAVIAGIVLLFAASFAILQFAREEEKVTEPAPQQPAVRVAAVSITAKGFEPAIISVKKGTKIVWTNKDGALHQIASNPHAAHSDLVDLKSEILNNGQTYEYTANKTGSFGYHDERNPTTNGTLEVKN